MTADGASDRERRRQEIGFIAVIGFDGLLRICICTCVEDTSAADDAIKLLVGNLLGLEMLLGHDFLLDADD